MQNNLFSQNLMSNLAQLSGAKTRSISPENLSGAKGKGGMAIEGPAAKAARDLGQGWKISPFVVIEPGETFTLANIQESGMTQTEAANKLGIAQSRVSDLVRGKWEKFSLEMLITLEARAGREVTLELAV